MTVRGPFYFGRVVLAFLALFLLLPVACDNRDVEEETCIEITRVISRQAAWDLFAFYFPNATCIELTADSYRAVLDSQMVKEIERQNVSRFEFSQNYSYAKKLLGGLIEEGVQEQYPVGEFRLVGGDYYVFYLSINRDDICGDLLFRVVNPRTGEFWDMSLSRGTEVRFVQM